MSYKHRASALKSACSFHFVLAAFVFLLAAPSLTHAQGVGSSRGLPSSSGGTQQIQGKVVFPEGPGAGKRARVSLTGTSFTGSSTQTDDDGVFRFNGLEAGPYTITVDGGGDYDVAVENVNIDRGSISSGRIIQVPIYLRPKGATAAMFAGIPKEAVEQYKKGMDSAHANNSKKAVEQLNKAVELHPTFGPALSELGIQYLKLGQPDKAAEVLSKAVQLSPKEFVPQLHLGIALLNKKDFLEAEKHLRQALVLNSASATAHMYLGMALLSSSKDEQTKEFHADRYAEAQTELETALKTGKDEVAQAHRYLGGIYWGNKEYKRAADEFEAYLKLSPKAADAEKLKAAIKELRAKG
jgi:Tfp pilus assembly protein PilF